ncbi:MAG: LysR family transcriptional regulator [Hydrogenophaga sp.]|uniref:LysR family transcriptional regulator n=1 Tax=Hydrogenophaga sp. TaxID=1904254 RepID=UPI002631FF1C|nr:LysR family transcriptional regulator [Hydrogenophaga sp.]MCV0437458.1 LysR family transcriptional regulator [Hydrogenophaga sp.]
MFHEVVRAGSVRAASDLLGVSASSITRQIQQLEHQIGATLLDRSSTGVAPTHAGKLVAQFAQSVVLEYDTLRADVNERRGLKGHIRVAAVESTMGKVIDAIAALREKFFDVTFSLSMLPAGRVFEAVKTSEVDVGVTFCAAPDPDLTVLARYVEPVVLAVSPNHDWAFKESVALHELSRVALGIPETTFGVRSILDEEARKCGLKLMPSLVTNSFDALRAFARSGAVSVLPRMSFDSERRANILKTVVIDSTALNETTADVITLRERRPSRLLKLFYSELERMF